MNHEPHHFGILVVTGYQETKGEEESPSHTHHQTVEVGVTEPHPLTLRSKTCGLVDVSTYHPQVIESKGTKREESKCKNYVEEEHFKQ